MIRILLLLVMAGLYTGANAQVVTVVDQTTEEALLAATLTSASPKAFTVTNVAGQADISAFRESKNIEIRILGYKTRHLSYTDIAAMDFTIPMESSPFSSDEIVVSATRWNQTSRKVPARVKSITAEKISLENPQTAADLLATSGEVYIQKSQQGGGSPIIRGFATNRLLYTVDGVRMNTAIFRSGNLQNVISLDPFAMERTEIIFGPGSVIYGSDAIGGVMGFQTLTPQLSLTDEILISSHSTARYSTANQEKTAHFDVSVGSRKWASVTSFSTNDYGDLRMGSDAPDEYFRPFYVERVNNTDVVVENEDETIQTPSGYTQINVMQKLRYRPVSDWDFQYGFHYSETSSYSRYDREVRYRNGAPRYGEWNYGPQKWMMNNLSATNTVVDGKLYDQLAVRLAQQYFEESRLSRDFNSPDREVRVEEVDAYSVNIDLNKSIGEKHELYYGLELVVNDVTSTGTNEDIVAGTSVDGPARYPQSTWGSYAAYVTNQFTLSNKLLLQAGFRYNIYKLDAEFDTRFYPFPFEEASMNNGALTGSIGAVFTPAPDWQINANLSTGFRAPNVDDAGKVFDSEPGSVVVPNPDLEAEYAYNIDLGVTKTFDDIAKFDVTGYYTILENAMVRRDYTLSNQDSIAYDGTLSQVQAIQNAAVATVYGMQMSLGFELPSGFGFSSHLNIQQGEEELDDGSTSPSRHAAPWFGRSKFNYTTDGLILEFYAEYSGEKSFNDLPESEKEKDYIYAVDENGNPYSPSWYTLNAKAKYKINEHFTVSSGVENLMDKGYRPYSSGIVAPGRNFIISISAAL